MIEEYKKINELLIKKYDNNKEMTEKHYLIKHILNDKDCFFKLTIEDSFALLKDLGVPDEQIEKKYEELISYENFKNTNNND
jgi:hypothetical protein